eukprot:2212742-Karenia_brevis.AAC.1
MSFNAAIAYKRGDFASCSVQCKQATSKKGLFLLAGFARDAKHASPALLDEIADERCSASSGMMAEDASHASPALSDENVALKTNAVLSAITR